MSFSLEFYSLSWDALRNALSQRKTDLLRSVEDQQWVRLLDDTDLGAPTHHIFPVPHDEPSPMAGSAGPRIAEGLDEIAEAMARKLSPGREPPELSNNAALVFAAFVRQLGRRIGEIRHDASVHQDHDGEMPMDFRAMFLDGLAGSCFGDHSLGENLAARPLFGLYHLESLSWGGLRQPEIAPLLAKYALPAGQKRDEEWLAFPDDADAWLNALLGALRSAQAAKADVVTLFLSVQRQFRSIWEEIED